jgi:hypothetical protein
MTCSTSASVAGAPSCGGSRHLDMSSLFRSAATSIVGVTGAVLLSGCAPSAPTSMVQTPPDLVVSMQDQNTTVQLSQGQHFILQLSSLNWSGSFDPAGIVQLIQGSSPADGIQGTYEAVKGGTTVLDAFGSPICPAGQACPQYVVLVSITFSVL